MKICPACGANPVTVPCPECDGFGFIHERHERLKAALDACDYQQFVIVADALRAVCDDLLKADLHSRNSWVLLGLLDGIAPTKEETKDKAKSRQAERRAA
jgi:hypothetical protein